MAMIMGRFGRVFSTSGLPYLTYNHDDFILFLACDMIWRYVLMFIYVSGDSVCVNTINDGDEEITVE